MNMLFGLLQPDEGEILIDGVPTILPNPAAAIKAGIGMVHQHFKLVPSLTVAENVFLGMEIRKAYSSIIRPRPKRRGSSRDNLGSGLIRTSASASSRSASSSGSKF